MENNRTNNTSFIAVGTIISADITCEGSIHISGIADGEIHTQQHLILNNTSRFKFEVQQLGIFFIAFFGGFVV